MKKIIGLIIALTAVFIFAAAPAEAKQTKTTLCHATHSETNPFVEITVANAAVFHAHDNHQDQEDIIPPYTYRGVDYPGQNWNAVTEAFLDNGCETPALPTTVPESTTTIPETTTTVPETTTTVPSTSTTVVQTTTTIPATTTTVQQPVGTEDTAPPTRRTTTVTETPTELAHTGFISTILKIALFLIVVGFLIGLASRRRRGY